MITIDRETKIATILKTNPMALEAIVSISPKFEKLRNPVLRKVIAGRTSIAMASKLGGCGVDDFFTKLAPLGFTIDRGGPVRNDEPEEEPVPDFLKNRSPESISELDVRPVIESGKDPLSLILQKVKSLEPGSVLKIINSFDPAPLRHLLGKQGFESFTTHLNDSLVHTFFYKGQQGQISVAPIQNNQGDDWSILFTRFTNALETVHVRDMEMPLPMLTILKALDTLPTDKALLVFHKRIPVFLLPELTDRKFQYRIKEIKEGEVELLIYRD